MYRIKIGTMTTELPIVSPLSRVLRFVPKAILPMVLHSNDTGIKETQNSAASAKASDDSNTAFAGVAAEAERGEKLDEEDVSTEAGIFTVAGTDTTAVTMTYLVWCVFRDLSCVRRLRVKLLSWQITTLMWIFWNFPGSMESSLKLSDFMGPLHQLFPELHLLKALSWVAFRSPAAHSLAHNHTPSTEILISSPGPSSKSSSTSNISQTF